MNRATITWGAAVLGVVFLALAVVYWVVPAGSLPTVIPGFEAGSTQVHFKHGIGSLLLALALFAFAWFRTGPQRIRCPRAQNQSPSLTVS